MALIEGVGDEVTLLFGLMLLLMVLLLAWISTRTSEPPQHLFTSSTGPAPSHLVTPSQRTTEDASSSSSSSPSSLSSSETSSVTGTLPTSDPDQDRVQDQVQDQDQDQDRVQAGGRDGDGVRNRGESLSSQRNMVVRLKFLNDTERTAQVKPQDTIGYIKRTYFAGQEDQVRFIYQGQLLQDDARTLASLNLVHNCVLHCHISQHAAGRRGAAGGPGPGDQVQVALNVGSLMVPLLVLMLAVLWYCQIQYRHFFTAPATASLVGVTVLLSMAAFGVYRR